MKLSWLLSSCFSILITLFFVSVNAKHIDWKINLGGDSVSDFMAESEILNFGEDTPKMRFHGEIKASSKDKNVFKTQRFAREQDLVFTVPVPDGIYSVTLLFAETWDGAFGNGKRVFDVYLGSNPNGVVKVIEGMDPYRHGGPAGPVRRTFRTIPTQGGLTVALRPIKQNPQIAGIIIKGYSYSDVFLDDLPVLSLDKMHSEDFSILSRIGPTVPLDPSLLYNPGSISSSPQAGPGSTSPATTFNSPMSQHQTGSIDPSLNVAGYGVHEGSINFEKQMNSPMQQNMNDRFVSASRLPPPSSSFQGNPSVNGVNMELTNHAAGSQLSSSSMTGSQASAATSLPNQFQSSGIMNRRVRLSMPDNSFHESSTNAPIHVYHRHLTSLPQDYGLEEQAFTLAGMRDDRNTQGDDFLGHTSVKLGEGSTQQNQLFNYNEAMPNYQSQPLDSTQIQDDNLQAGSQSATTRRVQPTAEFSQNQDGAIWNEEPNFRPPGMLSQGESSLPPMQGHETIRRNSFSELLPNAAANYGGAAQTIPFENQATSNTREEIVTGNGQATGFDSSSVSSFNNRRESIALETGSGISRSTDFDTTTPDTGSTQPQPETETQLPQTAAVNVIGNIQQDMAKTNMNIRPSQEQNGIHVAGPGPLYGGAENQYKPTNPDGSTTREMVDDYTNSAPLNSRLHDDNTNRAVSMNNNDAGIPTTASSPRISQDRLSHGSLTPSLEVGRNQAVSPQMSSSYSNTESLSTNPSYSAPSSRETLHGIATNVHMLTGHTEESSNTYGEHGNRKLPQPESISFNVDQSHNTEYQNIPIIRPGSEYKMDPKTMQYDPNSSGTQRMNALSKEGNLEGICLHNSTHCSCGMLDERSQSGEECLYVMNENVSPMICARKTCNAKLVCACAPGATAICKRTEIKTILVPAAVNHHVSSEPNIVFCKREQLDRGIAVLTPAFL